MTVAGHSAGSVLKCISFNAAMGGNRVSSGYRFQRNAVDSVTSSSGCPVSISGASSPFWTIRVRAVPAADRCKPPPRDRKHQPPQTQFHHPPRPPVPRAGQAQSIIDQIFGLGFGRDLYLNRIFFAQPGHHLSKMLSGLAVWLIEEKSDHDHNRLLILCSFLFDISQDLVSLNRPCDSDRTPAPNNPPGLNSRVLFPVVPSLSECKIDFMKE